MTDAVPSPAEELAHLVAELQARGVRRVEVLAWRDLDDPDAGGSIGIYLDGLFARWGMRDDIRAKAILVKGGLVAKHLLDGSADVAIHQISEIKAVPGVTLVGPIPADIQNHTVYAAANPPGEVAQPVQDLLKFLTSPDRVSLLQDKGMESVVISR